MVFWWCFGGVRASALVLRTGLGEVWLRSADLAGLEGWVRRAGNHPQIPLAAPWRISILAGQFGSLARGGTDGLYRDDAGRVAGWRIGHAGGGAGVRADGHYHAVGDCLEAAQVLAAVLVVRSDFMLGLDPGVRF